MKAQELLNARIKQGDDAFAELRVWRLPKPVRGSTHPFKYRLAFVIAGVCVLRFDNEAGKGDHCTSVRSKLHTGLHQWTTC